MLRSIIYALLLIFFCSHNTLAATSGTINGNSASINAAYWTGSSYTEGDTARAVAQLGGSYFGATATAYVYFDIYETDGGACSGGDYIAGGTTTAYWYN